MAFGGYRILWMLVFFDLPVADTKDRKAYTKFRNYLLDEGFQMAQFSVYFRLLSGKEMAESMLKRISNNLPPKGKVEILTITDKQYENILCFRGKKHTKSNGKPDQLTLF